MRNPNFQSGSVSSVSTLRNTIIIITTIITLNASAVYTGFLNIPLVSGAVIIQFANEFIASPTLNGIAFYILIEVKKAVEEAKNKVKV